MQNAAFKNRKNGWNWLVLSLFVLLFSENISAQHCTHAPGQPINLSITGQTTGLNVTTEYVLTDAARVIKYHVSTLPFNGVAVGNYFAHAITWKTGAGNTAPVLAVGTNISAIGGTCVSATDGLPVNVCNCNGQSTDISFVNYGAALPSGETEVFILADAAGVILNTSSSTSFTALGNGDFDVFTLRYKTANPPAGLTVGQNVGGLVSDCQDLSQPLRFQVCPVASPCPDTTYQICPGDIFTVDAGPNLSNIQWFKDSQPISGATAQTYFVTTVGSYHFTATTSTGCDAEDCCPAVFLAGNCQTACPTKVCLPVKIRHN